MGTLAVVAILGWAATAGGSVVALHTRSRSGLVRDQLVSHVASSGSTAPSIVPTSAEMIAAAVAGMALVAMAFVVVTLLRRRVVAS
jgi:hypothetical protein